MNIVEKIQSLEKINNTNQIDSAKRDERINQLQEDRKKEITILTEGNILEESLELTIKQLEDEINKIVNECEEILNDRD
jgi:hypothetical protein